MSQESDYFAAIGGLTGWEEHCDYLDGCDYNAGWDRGDSYEDLCHEYEDES